ncbi:MAG TPA: response regulator transcription factor [Terriglobales bacterium]|nr:response regulator transcription factor [Terriglobales bacterium]
MKPRILLVEDEQDLRRMIADRLKAEKFVVETAVDGEQGLQKVTDIPFDFIILDIMLPGRSGFDICRDIRQLGILTPILFLTARSQVVDKVVGLKLGADDYLTKPFDILELLARIEAVLRRASKAIGTSRGLHRFGTITIDLDGTEVMRNGELVNLSAREFQLLRYLLERRGCTVSREQILKEVWGYDEEIFTRTVDVHVFGLRQKLEDNPKKPDLIVTVPGLGYKFAR